VINGERNQGNVVVQDGLDGGFSCGSVGGMVDELSVNATSEVSP
jgi:hypothetical protein